MSHRACQWARQPAALSVYAWAWAVFHSACAFRRWLAGVACRRYRDLADEVIFNGRVAIPSPDDTLAATTSYNAAVALGATPLGHLKVPAQGIFKTYTNFNCA